jgi:AcrR family transcriptional regulator
MPGKRLSRVEQQERTRSKLMQAASKVFSCKGMQQGSIDEVAEEAGYTKGAFYANFKSKEELFLAMLDERFEERIRATEEAFEGEDEFPPEQARHAAADFARASRGDEEGERLFLEFATYALQNEDFREELLTRFGTLRARLAKVYERRMETYGIKDPPAPVESLVRMVIFMADGWALWRLLEPDQVNDELFESMVEIFTTGVGVMGGALEVEAAKSQEAAPAAASTSHGSQPSGGDQPDSNG